MHKIFKDGSWLDLVLINKKEIKCHLVDFASPTDHKVEIKESKKFDTYLDLVREQKNLLNMNVMVIPVVVRALGTIPKKLERRLSELKICGRIKTNKTTIL